MLMARHASFVSNAFADIAGSAHETTIVFKPPTSTSRRVKENRSRCSGVSAI
jgi:hypothetical protein